MARTEWYPATVPGEIHMDLLDNGMIEEPFYRLNERRQQWIGKTDWEYRTSFTVSRELLNKNYLELVCEGLDTYADIYLNGMQLGATDNMFRRWAYDIRHIVGEGLNTLLIVFNNVFKVNKPKWENAPFRLKAPPTNDQSDVQLSLYSRKAGFHYGWDWGPRLITAGVWRPVYLKAWEGMKLDSLYIIQHEINEKFANLEAIFEVTSDSAVSATLALDVEDQRRVDQQVNLKKGAQKVSFQFTIENPELWWTNGLGEQPLYQCSGKVEMEHTLYDEQRLRIGLRSLRVVRDKDDFGRSFYIELNGHPVFMKGANYIPQDNFQRRVTHEGYEHIINSAAKANMNMLRVWGGGIYEDDKFYELCDEKGILVWQDMMFACGMFPADEPFLETVAKEVKDNVKRLRNHPSVALYCGNNENEMIWYLAWKDQFSKKEQEQYEANLHQLFYKTIPRAIDEVDDRRFYLPTSPVAGFDGRSYETGNVHYWGVWHGKKPFNSYNHHIGRFMTEYGFQSYPEISTIRRFTAPEDRYLESEVMHSHQRCTANNRRDEEYGNRLIKHYMDQHFRRPANFGMFAYVSQLLQAYGVEKAIKAHRRNMSNQYCMGTLYWQIDDCWPVASWSGIDYYGRWKALHYKVRDLYKPIILSPVEENGELKIYVISDRLTPVSNAGLHITLMDFDGYKQWNKTKNICIAPNTSRVQFQKAIPEMLGDLDPDSHLLVIELWNGRERLFRDNYYFSEPKELHLSTPQINRHIYKSDHGYGIKLSSDRLAHSVFLSLNADNGQGAFTDNYFDLIPGEEVTVEYKSAEDELPGDFNEALNIISLVDSY